MITKKMSDLKTGEVGKIINLSADVRIKRRLLELGLITGQMVKVLSISPLKNSYLIALKNYSLCLRRSILKSIEVEIELWNI